MKFNLDDDVNVQISFNYLDKRRLTLEQILSKYKEILDNHTIIKDKKSKKRRAILIKNGTANWLISSVRSVDGTLNEIAFFEINDSDVQANIIHIDSIFNKEKD